MRILVAALIASLFATAASAQQWPQGTIRIIVGFTAGGSSDLIARILVPHLSDELGTTVIIESKPGAASTIAANYVSKADPDGYTFFLSNVSASTLAPYIYKDLDYDPVADFDEVMILGYIATVLLASPSTGIADLEHFVEFVKANPNSVLFGSGGHGTMNHLTGELINLGAGLDMKHVAYRGSAEAMNDLVAGVIPFQVDALTQNVGQIKAGAVNALAIAIPERSPAAPDIPTFVELGYPDIVALSWAGINAPAGTPPEIISTVHAALSKVMQIEEIKQQFATWGMTLVVSTPEEAEAFVARETAKWGDIIARSGAFN